MKFGWLKIVLTCVIATSGGGCAIIDTIEPRATALNSETAESKSTTVLTNVLRAAHSEPLQFTDIVSYSAQNSANFQMGSSLPIAVIPSTVNRTFSVSPSVQASGSNTFQVTNLNNQEFYYGLQTPISMQVISAYLKAGYEPHILLPLVISDIEIRANNQVSLWSGDGTGQASFAGFFTALNTLLRAGLSTETVRTSTEFGPLLSKRDATYILGQLMDDWKEEAPEVGHDKKTGKYQLRKSKREFRFCFDRIKAKGTAPYPNIDLVTADKSVNEVPLKITLGDTTRPLKSLSLEIKPKYFCGKEQVPDHNGGDEQEVIKFTTRSPQGVFRFLGEMIRTELGFGGGQPKSLAVPYRAGGHFNLFTLNNPSAKNIFATVRFKGEEYYVASDPSGFTDGSTRVLQFLQELLALQSSAKNVPAPNIISVIGQ